MRIPARTAGVLAALALAAAPAVAQDPRGILFLVQRVDGYENGNAVMEPIALIHENGYEDPLAQLVDGVTTEFDARWFAAGRRYGVLSRGVQSGTAMVVAPEEPGCGGTPGARARLAPDREDRWRAVAGEGLPGQPGAPWLRAATRDERRTLDRLAAALFAAHGIDVAARPEADTTVTTVLFHRNARPVLVGSYALKTTDEVMRQASAFIIAEDTQDGYRPAYVAFHEGRNPELARSELLDALDLDGDSAPELVLQNAYWESWDYAILKRDEHGWTQVYRGGGAGC